MQDADKHSAKLAEALAKKREHEKRSEQVLAELDKNLWCFTVKDNAAWCACDSCCGSLWFDMRLF